MSTLRADERDAVDPQRFPPAPPNADAADAYIADPSIKHLIAFFDAKGLAALKDEDRREHFYSDWLDYQKSHRLYASVLASKDDAGGSSVHFDLLRFARFIEVFGYFSPAHAYSLQVSYLALFAIRLGTNDALKREAMATIEAGGLLAFGISEKNHGSDLLANEFTLRPTGNDGQLIANGRKYYIGNANVAAIIAIFANKTAAAAAHSKRALPALYALRPAASPAAFRQPPRKIRTLGIRAAFVGEFEVTEHEVGPGDIIADGRDAWDAVFGAVTLGRFFLGFGSIGICEHAMQEATAHLARRALYRQPAVALPHIRTAMSRAFARLSAMKLYAFRALDYVAAANENDRRYLLFTAVQKAKVSTDGVRVMSLISECVGAKGFESDTYIEMALRDIQLIPGLEGSTHLNLKLSAQFVNRYFAGNGASAGAKDGDGDRDSDGRGEGEGDGDGDGNGNGDGAVANEGLIFPPFLSASDAAPRQNPYLMSARTGPTNTIDFPHFLAAYRASRALPNVRRFLRQADAFRRFIRHGETWRNGGCGDLEITLHVGQCLACIAYAQLIAEATTTFHTPAPLVSAIFDLLIADLTAAALALSSLPQVGTIDRHLLHRCIRIPHTTAAEWGLVADRMLANFAN